MGETISAISVLLVFLVLLFSISQSEIKSVLKKEKPRNTEIHARSNYVVKVRTLLYKSIGINIIFFITFWVLLPDTLTIIKRSDINIFQFDTLKTIFVLIEAGMLSILTVSLLSTSKIIRKLIK